MVTMSTRTICWYTGINQPLVSVTFSFYCSRGTSNPKQSPVTKDVFLSIKPFQHTSRRKKALTLGWRKEKFRQRTWGSNPGPLALRVSALTTELSRHSRELRWTKIGFERSRLGGHDLWQKVPSSPVTSKVFPDVSPELPLASSSQNDGGVQKTTNFCVAYVSARKY